jgi:hypothetical protein
MISILALSILSLSAFANIDADAEAASLAGQYTLVREIEGNCPAVIKVKNEISLGLGIYGDQPGDVIAQLSALNLGGQLTIETHPMTGWYHGFTVAKSSIGNGKLERSFISRSVTGKKRFSDKFVGQYGADTLNFTREYDGTSFNNICIKQVCEYIRSQMP